MLPGRLCDSVSKLQRHLTQARYHYLQISGMGLRGEESVLGVANSQTEGAFQCLCVRGAGSSNGAYAFQEME